MRVLKKNFKKGFAAVVPKTLDDLWHLYNLIYKGDLVYSRTTREVKPDVDYSRPQKGKRVSVILGLRVEDVIWDRSLNRLRIHGMIHEAPENVAGRGSHHTFSLSVNKSITIVKEKWSKHHIDRLNRATRSEVPPVIVVSIDSEEFCVAILRQYGIDIRVEGRIKLPGKLEAGKRVNAMHKYLKTVLKVLNDVWRSNRVSIVIIGVGFVKNQFMKFIDNEASDVAKSVIGVKSVNAGGLAGIREALRSGILDKAFKHLRIAEESLIVEEFLGRLAGDKGDVTYGLEGVRNADSVGAVETFLITDFTIRDASDKTRLVLEELMRDVEKKGGKVIVISIEHEAGEKLHALGGIAALLRYPVSSIRNPIDHEI